MLREQQAEGQLSGFLGSGEVLLISGALARPLGSAPRRINEALPNGRASAPYQMQANRISAEGWTQASTSFTLSLEPFPQQTQR